MKILFLGTGGTIDKDYPRRAMTYAFEISEPAVKRMLEVVNPNFEYEIKSLLKKDSQDITDKDREMIFNEAKKAKENKIIITHGTDTMIKTAEKLSVIKDKTIVIVGSALPERFINSDAQFSVGFAIGVCSTLENGVYIAMNGRIYKWNEVKKDQKTGKFIEK